MTLWGIHSATKAAIVQASQGQFALNSLLYSSVFKHGDGRSVDPKYTMVLISLAEEKIMDPGCCLDVPLSHLVNECYLVLCRECTSLWGSIQWVSGDISV